MATLDSTDDAGDYFNMAVARKVPLTEVRADDVIVIPLASAPAEAVIGAASATSSTPVFNATSLAAAPVMYVRLSGQPQPRMVFGTLLAYSGTTVDMVVPLGALVKFPPPDELLVAKATVVGLLAEMQAPPKRVVPGTVEVVSKRPCIRQPEEGGGFTDAEIERGTSKYILDLDGRKHATRNKVDISIREKDLGFLFRMLDRERWPFAMGIDYLLQQEEYRITILQQGRLRKDHRHKAFISCGSLDRVQSLRTSQNSESLKLLLTGQILVEGSSPSLCMADFSVGQKISSGNVVCPHQNRPLVAALRNLELVLQVFFSAAFKDSMKSFLFDLEGDSRPMELVSADLLLFSVEELLRNFFRAVRSERGESMPDNLSLTSPEECALQISVLLEQLSFDLSDHVGRAIEEEYYRVRIAREISIAAMAITTPAPGCKKANALRPCAGHLGKQLRASYPDGRDYKCMYGKECVFSHIGKNGKTPKELKELISRMPAKHQEDLMKAAAKVA